MKVERKIDDFETKLRDLQEGGRLDIDLLGWGVTKRKGDYVPILDYDRFVQSIACPKEDTQSKKYVERPWLKEVYNFTRWNALLLAGGWMYGNVTRTAVTLTEASRRKIMKTINFMNVEVPNTKDTEFGDFFQVAMPVQSYYFGDNVLDELFAPKPDSKLEAKIQALDARSTPTFEKKFASYLAANRIDEYLMARGLDEKEIVNSLAFKKTSVWIDTMREFNSIRAVLSKQNDFIRSPAKWKFNSTTPEALADPYKHMDLRFDYKQGIPRGAIRKIAKRGTTKHEIPVHQPGLVTDINLHGGASLLPSASYPRGVGVADLPLAKKSKQQPITQQPVTTSNVKLDLVKVVTHQIKEERRKLNTVKQIVSAYTSKPSRATYEEMKEQVGTLGNLTRQEWLALAQSKFGVKGDWVPELEQWVKNLEPVVKPTTST
jgi:hypothetical protein